MSVYIVKIVIFNLIIYIQNLLLFFLFFFLFFLFNQRLQYHLLHTFDLISNLLLSFSKTASIVELSTRNGKFKHSSYILAVLKSKLILLTYKRDLLAVDNSGKWTLITRYFTSSISYSPSNSSREPSLSSKYTLKSGTIVFLKYIKLNTNGFALFLVLEQLVLNWWFLF